MDKEEIKLIATFSSVNHAMQVEKALLDKDLKIKTIPTPREISNSCGLCIMTDMENFDSLLEAKKTGLKIEHLWKHIKGEAGKNAELLV